MMKNKVKEFFDKEYQYVEDFLRGDERGGYLIQDPKGFCYHSLEKCLTVLKFAETFDITEEEILELHNYYKIIKTKMLALI